MTGIYSLLWFCLRHGWQGLLIAIREAAKAVGPGISRFGVKKEAFT